MQYSTVGFRHGFASTARFTICSEFDVIISKRRPRRSWVPRVSTSAVGNCNSRPATGHCQVTELSTPKRNVPLNTKLLNPFAIINPLGEEGDHQADSGGTFLLGAEGDIIIGLLGYNMPFKPTHHPSIMKL